MKTPSMLSIVAALFAALTIGLMMPDTADAGGNCLGVSTVRVAAVNHHVNAFQAVAVPVAASYQQVAVQGVPLTTFNVAAANHCNAVAVANVHHAQAFQVLATPIVAHQAVVVQNVHHVRQRGLVIEQRVRRERRGLGRALFGR